MKQNIHVFFSQLCPISHRYKNAHSALSFRFAILLIHELLICSLHYSALPIIQHLQHRPMSVKDTDAGTRSEWENCMNTSPTSCDLITSSYKLKPKTKWLKKKTERNGQCLLFKGKIWWWYFVVFILMSISSLQILSTWVRVRVSIILFLSFREAVHPCGHSTATYCL